MQKIFKIQKGYEKPYPYHINVINNKAHKGLALWVIYTATATANDIPKAAIPLAKYSLSSITNLLTLIYYSNKVYIFLWINIKKKWCQKKILSNILKYF